MLDCERQSSEAGPGSLRGPLGTVLCLPAPAYRLHRRRSAAARALATASAATPASDAAKAPAPSPVPTSRLVPTAFDEASRGFRTDPPLSPGV